MPLQTDISVGGSQVVQVMKVVAPQQGPVGGVPALAQHACLVQELERLIVDHECRAMAGPLRFSHEAPQWWRGTLVSGGLRQPESVSDLGESLSWSKVT